MTSATYTDYPFTKDGVNFTSRVYSDSPLAKQISQMPLSVFANLNIEAIDELIGNPSLLTREELEHELACLNEGGSHSFIMLNDEVSA